MNGNGPLDFEATLNDTNWQARMDAMERRIMGLTNTAVREGSKVESVFQNLGQLAVGAFALNGLSDFPQQLIRVRGEFQNLEIAFTTMLGSKAKADAFLKEGVDFAAKTPFQLDEVAKAQKLMLAYGFSVQSIIPTLTKLGDVSAGLNIPLGELTELYGKTKTQGRLFADDFNSYVGRGIPLIQELSKQFKVAESEVKGLVESGKVGFPQVELAIESLTNGSSKINFGGLMAEQAKSLTGLTSNLADAYDRMLNEIGKDNQELLADTIKTATGFVENYEPILDTIKVLIATFGAYKAALVTTAVVQASVNVAGNVFAWLELATTIRSAKDAQIAFNLATSANPYALIAAALVALTTAIIVYKKELTSAQQLEADIAQARQEANSSADAEIAKVERLKRSISSEKLSRDDRTKALKELIAIAPDHLSALTLENIKTNEGTTAINNYVAARKKQLETERVALKIDESIKRELAAKRGEGIELGLFDKLKLAAAAAGGEGSFDYDKGKAQVLKEQQNEIIKTEQVRQAGLQKELEGIKSSSQATASGETVKQKARAVTVKQIEEEIKAKKESLSLNNSEAKNASINKEIDRLEAQKRKLTGEKTAAENKAARDADKVGPLGSLSYYDNVIRKTDEALSKIPKDDTKNIDRLQAIKAGAEQKAAEIRTLLETPAGSVKYFDAIASAAQAALEKTAVTNTAAIERQKQVIVNAQAEAEQARKLIVIRSFDEELSDKRSKYILYEKWVEEYGKASADNQFKALIDSGQSYVEYLNAEISKLESQRDKGKLNEKDAKNLGTLVAERNEVTGKKSPLDVFNESLEKAQRESASLADYLVKLRQKQEDLGKPTNTGNDIAIRRKLAEEVAKTQIELQGRLQQFLSSYASSGEQQLAIQKDFAEKRVALDQKYNGQKGDAYKASLKIIDDAEKQALQDYQQRKLEETDEFKETTKVILEVGEKRAAKEILLQRNVVEKAKKMYGENSEAYKRAQEKLDSLTQKNGGEEMQKTLSKYSLVAGQFGQALSQLGGQAGETGQALVGLASNIDSVIMSMDKNVDKTQLYATAISGLVTLFTAITDAAAKRRKAEDDYYASVIRQQQEYNLLLNEQLAIRSKNTNPFIDNYSGQLMDNFAAQKKAQETLDQYLKKLNEGRAKNGLKDQLDNAGALKLIGTGAGTGAAIGALIGGPAAPVTAAIGAVIGGAVGALTSLFGGATKKADEFGALLARYPGLIEKTSDGTNRINLNLAQTLIDTGQLDEKTQALVQTTIEWQKQVDATKQAIQDIIKTLVGDLGDKLRDGLVNAFKEGTEAALVFSNVLSDVIESFVTKLLFSKVFTPYFDKLAKDFEKSLDVEHGGDGDILDDLERSKDDFDKRTQIYFKGLQQYQDYAKSKGIDVLKPAAATSGIKNPNSIGGAIQATITENTANILAGQINAIRITQADTNAAMRQSLVLLSGIRDNTARISETNDLLKSVDKNLKIIASDPTRGLGGLPR